MHKNIFRLIALLTVSFAALWISSCEKLNEDVDVGKALIGQWRVSSTSVNLSVEGVELTQYLTDNFDYSNDEAQDIYDSIVADVRANSYQTITFSGDKSFQLNANKPDKEEGTWLVNADGELLYLNLEDDENELQIIEITANSLSLKNIFSKDDVDFDKDGTGESTLDIVVKQDLSKSSNGGAGG